MAGSAQAAEKNVAASGVSNVPITIPITGPDATDPLVPPPGTETQRADQYPSQIEVNGPAGTTITDLNVSLAGITHGWPRDLDILLVGPQGQKIVLMSDVCGPTAQALTNKTLMFDDEATDFLPIGQVRQIGDPPALDPMEPESCADIETPVKPTNKDYEDGYDSDHGLDNFNDPALLPPYATELAAFDGTDPNGTWRLYVTDDGAGPSTPDPATIQGWSLQITTTDPPAQPVTPPPVAIQQAPIAAVPPVCLPTPTTKTSSGKKGKVTLSATQFRINQRIFAAGVLRANAIDDWLKAGIQTNDLCGGGIGATKLAAGITTGATSLASVLTPPSPRPVVVPPLKVKKGVKFTASRSQLMINRRIAVALKERALALEARIEGRLTGGDLANDAVTAAKLSSGLTITGSPAQPKPGPSTAGTEPNVPIGNVQRNVATVRSSQQIAADGIRILNRVRAQLQSGLSGANFADKSIVTPNLAPGLRK